jgi:hypothetical protein
MINVNCDDMLTHATEANNACPRCGFFSTDWKSYPLWDGRLPEESLVPDLATIPEVRGENIEMFQGEEYPLTTSMGRAKLVAPRHDGVNVLELEWKATMYTSDPLVFSEDINVFRERGWQGVALNEKAPREFGATRTFERVQRWALERNHEDLFSLEPGHVCIIHKIESEWCKSKVHGVRCVRVCLVEEIDTSKNVLSLMTEDLLSLSGVPREAVTTLKSTTGIQHWRQFTRHEGEAGWVRCGNQVGAKNELLLQSCVRPSFSNNKADDDEPRWMVTRNDTTLYARPSCNADVVCSVNKGDVLQASDGAIHAEEANDFVCGHEVVAARMLGHSGVWRGASMKTWCGREGGDSSCASTTSSHTSEVGACTHGPKIIRCEHWSCCGNRGQWTACKTFVPAVGMDVLASPNYARQRHHRRHHRREPRFFPGYVKAHDEKTGLFTITFDDDDNTDSECKIEQIKRKNCFSHAEQDLLKCSVLGKNNIMQHLNCTFDELDKSTPSEVLLEDKDFDVYCVDFKSSLLHLPDGGILALERGPLCVDLMPSSENVRESKTRRIQVPTSWSLFAYQARKVLDCHHVVSASVMEYTEQGWTRGDMLNAETYQSALPRIQHDAIIACHEFASPQMVTDSFDQNYVFIAGEMVAYVGRRRQRRLSCAAGSGRILGFDRSSRQFKLMDKAKKREVLVDLIDLRRFVLSENEDGRRPGEFSDSDSESE